MKLRGRTGFHQEPVHRDTFPMKGNYPNVKAVFENSPHCIAIRLIFNDGSFIEYTQEET